jgi:hypothetical protein
MLLTIALNQFEQDVEPLLGCEAPIICAIGGGCLGVVVELADDSLHVSHFNWRRGGDSNPR